MAHSRVDAAMPIVGGQEDRRWRTKSGAAGRRPALAGQDAPGLAGVYGRLRITRSAGKPVATLVVEGTYVALIPDTSGPADATAICADEETMRKLLKGELNPFIASMRRQARLAGDRGFGTRVVAGLAGRTRRSRPTADKGGAVMTLDTVSHPGRQHLRGQRSARRSRRHADREPRPVPGGHALPLALDPDGRRHPARRRCPSTIRPTTRSSSSRR